MEKKAQPFVLVDCADSSRRQEIMIGSLVMLEHYYIGCDPIFCVRPLHCEKPMDRNGYKHPGIVLKIFNETGPDGVDKSMCWIALVSMKFSPMNSWSLTAMCRLGLSKACPLTPGQKPAVAKSIGAGFRFQSNMHLRSTGCRSYILHTVRCMNNPMRVPNAY